MKNLILPRKSHQIKVFKPPEPPQKLEESIDRQLESSRLKGWERFYVNAAKASKRHSERQIAKVEPIAAHLTHSFSEKGGAV
jgi:hypothetical protein